MWRILKSTTASIAKYGGSSSAERVGVPADGAFDLSAWELVNASQSDDEDLYSFEGDDGVGGVVDVVISDRSDPKTELEAGDGFPRESIVTVADVIPALSVSPPMTCPIEMTRNLVIYHDGDGYADYDVDEDDDMDMDYAKDELLAWELESKFGKRVKKMGKLGKKGIQKHAKKRLPCYYKIRPGNLY